nr:MAG TPA: hypothetical protein [Caudoviricetes sp.]
MTKDNGLYFVLLSYTQARIIMDWLMVVQGYPYFYVGHNFQIKHTNSADIPLALTITSISVHNNRVHVYGEVDLGRIMVDDSVLSFADFEELFSDVTERLPGVAFSG